MFKGSNGKYHWIEWEYQTMTLHRLLTTFPQIVVNKYLINTSFDGRPLRLMPEQVEQGWVKRNDLAISPQIDRVEQIPEMSDYDWDPGEDLPDYGYDEWYVFDAPTAFDNYEVFVDHGSFSLSDPELETLQQRFWQQLEILNPHAFLATGDNLICVTEDRNIFDLVAQWSENLQ